MTDFQSLRKEYEDQGIDCSVMLDCPVDQFKQWLDEAIEHAPGSWFEANAMSLATSDSNGNVSVRVVLLKGFDRSGFRFFTNYESEKGKQLAANPNCSVVFHWPYLGRQIRITGTAEKTSRETSQQYFHSRPRGAQIGAAVSNQSATLVSRAELAEKMKSLDESLGGAEVPLPENWGGYLIKPKEFEFWQGRSNRLHDRIVYQWSDGNWQTNWLSP